jgi:Fic-DOC domain mobile mystery protein B
MGRVTTLNWGGEPSGATPLGPDETDLLIPTDVATRADLNAVERDNILSARLWAFSRRGIVDADTLLQTTTLDAIHRRMFGNVWKWAGKRRTRDTNIGSDPAEIVMRLKDVLDDARYWHDHNTFDRIETAVRIHHRIVQVHPYVNGNGRHARFVADLYLHVNGEDTLPWRPDESDTSVGRATYISALQLADRGDYAALIAYAAD